MYARYCSGVALTSQASRSRQPRGARRARHSSYRRPRLIACSSGTAVCAGSRANSRNPVSLSLLSSLSPKRTVPPHQCATVVYGAPGSACVGGHSGRNTGGSVCSHLRPQSGNAAAGVPTVSPTLKYTSCGATRSSPVVIQICSSPGSVSTKADRRNRPTALAGSECHRLSRRSALAAASRSMQPSVRSRGSGFSFNEKSAIASAKP